MRLYPKAYDGQRRDPEQVKREGGTSSACWPCRSMIRA